MRASSSLSVPVLFLLLGCCLAPTASGEANFHRLHNHRQQMGRAMLDASPNNATWLLGCMAGSSYNVEAMIAEQGPFRLQFDTGSSTLGVLSSLCTNAAECGSDLGTRLNVSRGVHEGRLLGPHGSLSIVYGDSTGYTGPLYDAAVSLPGTSQPVVAATRLAAMSAAPGFFDTSLYCPFDSHSVQPDFWQGILGAGRGGELTGQGDTLWLEDVFEQHPEQRREFTYAVCPMDGGRLWVGDYDGDEAFACSPVIGRRWTVQACGLSIRLNSTTQPVPLGAMKDFGTCGSADQLDECALVDTGTAWLMLPPSVYQRFVSALRSHPAYVAAFGTSGDPFDPASPFNCSASKVPLDELRRQLPDVHIQLSNSSAVGGQGTCTTNHSIPLPGVDGYLSRFSAPGEQYPLYCPTLVNSAFNPKGYQHFTVLGNAVQQTLIIRHQFNSTAEEASHVCFAPSSGCEEPAMRAASER